MTAFEVTGMTGEYACLEAHGVVFTREPVTVGPWVVAVFSDTCGNLIQAYQPL